jgi:large subunit ribosomal protein L29
MKAKELRTLSLEDLLKKNAELREELFKLRFQHGIRRLENHAKLGLLRKNSARIQTVLADRNQK